MSRCRSVATLASVAGPAGRVGGFEYGESQYRHGLVGEAEAAERLAGAHAALQRGADQVGAQPALDVGAGPDAQHVERDDPGAVAQRLHPVFLEGLLHRRPD